MSSQQGIYWILTIPRDEWSPPESLPDGVRWIRGQCEIGGDTGYEHWQIMVGFEKKARRAAVKRIFGSKCHAELSRSAAADAYVWKDDTSIAGTRFELGCKPLKRNNKLDWDKIRTDAKAGRFDDIPADVAVRYFGNLQRMHAYYLQPRPMERMVHVFWGPTGTGKSREAWQQAGPDAYAKIPSTKFWDGYRGQENVVIDEFGGLIDIGHLLRWCDRYSCLVDIKGSTVPLAATRIWITSNIEPSLWYGTRPGVEPWQIEALLDRMDITYFPKTPHWKSRKQIRDEARLAQLTADMEI